MVRPPSRVDVCVLGGGTAGSAVARFAAEAGLSVMCIERRSLARAGAHWVNGVPDWTWARVGLPAPEAPELRGRSGRFHLVAGMKGPRITVDGHQSQVIDMRFLLARLRRGAEVAGARFVFDSPVRSVDGGRVQCDSGSITCNWVIDASGLGGYNLLGNPSVAKQDICTAAQEVRHCHTGAAQRFFAEHGAAPDEALCFSGIAGGYSVLNLHLSGSRLSILTGTIPANGHPSGRKLLNDFVAQHSWIGEREFGGAGAIPIRRPFDTLASANVAAIGDAASQVFPAHGSGIAVQLLAARILVDNLVHGRGVVGYEREFQRSVGSLCAGYDVFRRFSQDLALADLAKLMEAGIMRPETSRSALEQRLPDLPSPKDLKSYTRSLTREPKLAARLLKLATAMTAVRQLYRIYPGAGPRRALWSQSVARLVN